MINAADMQKRMEESKRSWDKIDEILARLNSYGAQNLNGDIVALLTLLVEQIRPAYSPEALEASMKEILDMFTGGNKNGK